MHKLKLIAEGSTYWHRLIKRWGISFLIDDDLLFDTFGDSSYFLRQIAKYQIDLAKIRHIVISHEHWDHIAGLKDVLKMSSDSTVYICSHSSAAFKENIASLGCNIIEINGMLEIKKGVYTTGEIPSVYKASPYPFSGIGCENRGEKGQNFSDENGESVLSAVRLNHFRRKNAGIFCRIPQAMPEQGLYEQSIIIKSDSANVVVTGCAHPGLMNILKHIENNFNEQLDIILGGFHLRDLPSEYISLVVRQIKNMGIKKAGPAHCTGGRAVKIFKDAFKERFIKLFNGIELEV